MAETFTARAELVIPASVDRVWQALATAEGFGAAFEGMKVESGWKVGDPIVWSGTWEGKAFRDKGVLLAVEPPRRLVYTYWTPFWGPAPTAETTQTITYEFAPEGSGTRAVIAQANVPDAAGRDRYSANWAELLGKVRERLA